VHEVVVGDIFVAVVIVIINFTSWLGALPLLQLSFVVAVFFLI